MKKVLSTIALAVLGLILTTGMVHAQAHTHFFIPKLGETADQVKAKIVASQQPSEKCTSLTEQEKALRDASLSADRKTRKQAQAAYREFETTHETALFVCDSEQTKVTGSPQSGSVELHESGAWSMTIDFKEGVVTKASGIYSFGSALPGNPNFDEFVASATKQYGDATQTVKTVQNSYGAKFELRSAAWALQKGGLLTIEETLDFVSNVGFTRPLFIYLCDKEGLDAAKTPAADPFK